MIEVVFSVRPQNLPGLNRLATELNTMKTSGNISAWHLGDASKQTLHVEALGKRGEMV